MKISKKNRVLFSIVALIFISPYIYFINLDEYSDVKGDIVSKDGVVYDFNPELSRGFNEREVNPDKVIGRIKGVGFFETFILGPRVYKLREYDKKEAIVLTCIDDDYVYKKK